jgi:hypothetical protein
MVTTTFLDSIPIWGMYIFTFLLALLAFELGYRLGPVLQKRFGLEKGESLNAIVGTTLSLLAFLLAFVISMATDRFDNRRQLVVAEASAIRTAYLQAGYLNDPYPAQIRSLLGEYVDLRIANQDNADLQAVKTRSEDIQAKLWKLTESVVKEYPGRDEISLYVASVNEVINVHTRRAMAALYSRLPWTIVYGLYMVAALSMMMVGFHNSYGEKRNMFSILVLIFIFTIVIMLIIDLDRPQEGFLKVNQQALIDLQRQIQGWKP